MSDAPDMLPGPQPTIGGPNQDVRNRINNADISMFDMLANEAARTRTKSAGRDLINRRNNLLGTLDPYQRAKVGNQYYMSDPRYGRPDEGFLPQDSATNFIDLISRGDNDFLQGLADDYGSGGNTGTGGGNTNNGGNTGNTGGSGGNSGGNFDPGAFQSQIQQLIQTMMGNQQSQFNNTLASMQGSAPTLSAGSVSNMYSSAADRANSRRSGIANTLAQRGRRSSSRGPARRYF